MSLAAFQRAMADMAASPALCGRVREDADAALAAYALSDVERRRVASAAAQVGMRVNCMLYRSNRLSPLASQLPNTFLVLGSGLRAVADGYWAENPVLERNAPTEVRRFAAFVQRRAAEGAIDEPLVPQVLAFFATSILLGHWIERFLLIYPSLCQIKIPDHDREHVVEIMSDAARQLTNGFDLLHLAHLRLRFCPGLRSGGQRRVGQPQLGGRTFHFTRRLIYRTRLLRCQSGQQKADQRASNDYDQLQL